MKPLKRFEKQAVVSVIMPNFNGEEFIETAISSVLNQTYSNIELIIVDDGSTDRSVSLVEHCMLSDGRIRFIQNPKNKGVAFSRNVGIAEAKGRYIAFLDSDDIWDKRKLDIQLAALREAKSAIVFSSYNTINEQGKNIGQVRAKRTVTINMMEKVNHIGNLTGMYDTVKIGKVFSESMGHEDYTLWFKAVKNAGYAIGVSESTASYRVRSKSVSANKFKAATWQWRIYRNFMGLNVFRAVNNFIFYSLNSALKYGISKFRSSRLNSTRIEQVSGD